MYPHAAALRCEGTTTSYSELHDDAARFASHLLDHGMNPGDRLGVMLPNRPEFAVVYYGVLYAGGVVVPMNPLQSAREVEFFLSNTGARTLFHAPQCASAATAGALAADASPVAVDAEGLASLISGVTGHPQPVPRGGHDTAVILHTSGTTGVPKGAELTHRNLVRNQAATARNLLNLGPDDVVMGCLPLFHAFGMTCGLVSAISTGATLALLPRFDPAPNAGTDCRRTGHGLRRCTDHVRRDAGRRRALRRGRQFPAHLYLGWGRDASGRPAPVRGTFWLHRPRGLRLVGDVAGGVLQSSGCGAQGGLDRHSDQWRRDAGGGRGGQRRALREPQGKYRSEGTTS